MGRICYSAVGTDVQVHDGLAREPQQWVVDPKTRVQENLINLKSRGPMPSPKALVPWRKGNHTTAPAEGRVT